MKNFVTSWTLGIPTCIDIFVSFCFYMPATNPIQSTEILYYAREEQRTKNAATVKKCRDSLHQLSECTRLSKNVFVILKVTMP